MANATVTLGPTFEEQSSAPPRLHRLAFAVLRAGLVAAGLGVLLSYLVLAATHLGDRFQLNFCSSIYASLAAHLNHGVFYPELYDGARYGGTRYMPLEFVLHAGLARLTGEYIISGKILTYTLTFALCAQLWFVLRSAHCPRSVATATISFLFLTDCGYLAATTIRGDLLPVVCQFAALLLVHAQPTRGRVALAGFCCALALLAKFSALWGPAAITAYFLVRDRRYLPYFLGATILTAVAVLVSCHWLTSGRMYASFAALSVAGVSARDVLCAPLMLLWKLGRSGNAVSFLIPALAVELGAAAIQRRNTLLHYGAYACLANTCVVFTDRAADTNHLLDLIVFAVALSGVLWGALPPLRAAGGAVRFVLALTMLWVLFTSWVNTLVFPVLGAVRSVQTNKVDPAFSVPPLADLIADDGPILAEDGFVELSRSRLPIVMDPYAVARMSISHPELTEPLVQRIEAREFAYVVLLQRLDAATPATDRSRWEDRAFGPAVVTALRQHYRFHAEREGYVVYVPVGANAVPPR